MEDQQTNSSPATLSWKNNTQTGKGLKGKLRVLLKGKSNVSKDVNGGVLFTKETCRAAPPSTIF